MLVFAEHCLKIRSIWKKYLEVTKNPNNMTVKNCHWRANILAKIMDKYEKCLDRVIAK